MTRPKGILVAVGGGEDKEDDMVVLRKVLDSVRGEARRVEVVPTASREPREAARPYLRAFEELGIGKVDTLDVRSREEADRDETVERVRGADIVYFTGGDQRRLADVVRGTRMMDAIHEKYHGGGVLAGTSAGAAAMSATMISGGDPKEGAMQKENVDLDRGLALLPDVVIDTHFLDRGRLARLLEVIAGKPGYVGFGIDEDTAIVVREGRHVEVVGSGLVTVIDGKEMRTTNVTDIDRREPIVVEHVVLHTLAEGYRFDLLEHAFLGRAEEPREARPRKAEEPRRR